jgi:hypothetical protein
LTEKQFAARRAFATSRFMPTLQRTAPRGARQQLFVLSVVAGLGVLAPLRALAEPPLPAKNFFYHGQDYGSESQFGPLNVFANVGFSVVGKANGFGIYGPVDVDYLSSLKELGGSYVHVGEIPVGYGSYWGWARNEFGFGLASLPNFFFHFLGEGMLSRKLEEYNRAQGMSPGWARFLAIATVVAAQQMNELQETKSIPVGDSLADTLVNNTLGILFFSFDGFAELFASDYLRLYYWPGQAMIDVRDAAMYNNSESYLFRVTLGGWTRAKVNVLAGIPSQGVGVSYPVRGEDSVGVMVLTQGPLVPEYPYAKGPQLARISYVSPPVESTDPVTTADASQVAARLTWDRGGSLLASLEVGFPVRLNVIANIYPGFVRAGPLQFGAYVYADASVRAVGLTLSNLSVMPAMRF